MFESLRFSWRGKSRPRHKIGRPVVFSDHDHREGILQFLEEMRAIWEERKKKLLKKKKLKKTKKKEKEYGMERGIEPLGWSNCGMA